MKRRNSFTPLSLFTLPSNELLRVGIHLDHSRRGQQVHRGHAQASHTQQAATADVVVNVELLIDRVSAVIRATCIEVLVEYAWHAQGYS